MEGVIILNSSTSNFKAVGISVFVAGILLLALFILLFIKKRKEIGIYALFLILFLGIVFSSIGIRSLFFNKYLHTEYEVLIEDSVSLQEFHKHYEILNKRGKIWVVRKLNKK